MKTWHLSRCISLLLVVLVLSACGRDDPQAMVASAKAYLAKNDPNAAIVQLKNALQQAPNNAEARLLLARALLDGGDVVGAETELRKAIELKAPEDEALPLLARVLLQQREMQKMTSELAETHACGSASPGRSHDLARLCVHRVGQDKRSAQRD